MCVWPLGSNHLSLNTGTVILVLYVLAKCLNLSMLNASIKSERKKKNNNPHLH